ncbi:MAG TPA: hypothetical protein DGH68_08940, partial [Bacteroidetes bacterium]|nr:hypothetical protein [Bacteroidota bacterium]
MGGEKNWLQAFSFFSVLLLSPLVWGDADAQLADGILFRRVSRISNFEFSIHNDGMIWGDYMDQPPQWQFGKPVAHWPRSSFHMDADALGAGIVLLAQKSGHLMVSDANFMRRSRSSHGPFDQMVPGRIGDPNAGYDPDFNGVGWRYVDNPDYIVYSSLDYDSLGVDISGSNMNDWPIRFVNGKKGYVADRLARTMFRPAYASDEDLFTVFKDTDTRADQWYSGPLGPSIPIGIQVQNQVYTWGSGPGKDIVIFEYDVINCTSTQLDSCFMVFGAGLEHTGSGGFARGRFSRRIDIASSDQQMAYITPTVPNEWVGNWIATAKPPTVGYPLLSTPRGYDGQPVGLRYAVCTSNLFWFVNAHDSVRSIVVEGTDSIAYRNMSNPHQQNPSTAHDCQIAPDGPAIGSGPFPMSIGDTARFSLAFIFADSLPHLLLMDEFIRRVYNSGFKRPVPPPASHLRA